MAIIAVFSGLHTREKEIIDGLSEKLGFSIVDNSIIETASSKYGVSLKKIEQTYNGTLSAFSKFTFEREKNTAAIRLSIAELVQNDNIIITGNAVHLIPRSITHILKICIIANMDFRIEQAVRETGVSPKDAHNSIVKDDRNKTIWSDYVLGKPPFDDSLFDIVIAMQDSSVEQAVELIFNQTRNEAVRTTKLSVQAAKDFLLSAKVQFELAKEGHFPDVYSEDGNVSILINKYVYRLEKYEADLKKIVSKVDGVHAITAKTGPKYAAPSIIPLEEIEMPSKILLVDDEKEFVHTLSERLSTRNLESSVVYDGEQALEFVKNDEPDVMVLDLKMPGIDGIEVLRRVKKEHCNVEVIILTGHGSEKEEILAEELGAFAYLHKPVNIDLLAQVMKEAYKKVNEKKNNLAQ